MSLNDKLKQAVDKVDPDRIVAELKASVGGLARQHGGQRRRAQRLDARRDQPSHLDTQAGVDAIELQAEQADEVRRVARRPRGADRDRLVLTVDAPHRQTRRT